MRTTWSDEEMFYINFNRAEYGLPPLESNRIL